ncbi:alpha/beta fold hydrolase [Leifsonia sp. NPDC058194]|uniref:alpha/beta fold hydrolase n=1 Tax=Leifsonia sp. NPDC058194 TaxID=3346374 RepID=UPI0036D9EFF2
MSPLRSATRAQDLVPGDLDAVRTEAAVLDRRSGEYDSLDLSLRAAVARASWSGRTADAFAEAATELRRRVQRASDDFARGSSAVAVFSHSLEWAQAEAERALVMWREAEDAERSQTPDSSPLLEPLAGRLVSLESPRKVEARRILDGATRAVEAAEREAVRAVRELAASAPRPLFASSTAGFDLGTGSDLLTSLSTLSGSRLAAFLGRHPDLAGELARLGAPAIARWWATLSNAQRAALIDRIPDVIGNLEGVPYSDRDTANVSRLRALYEEARTAVGEAATHGTPTAFQAAKDRLTALEFLFGRYRDGRGPRLLPPELLIALDVSRPGTPLGSIAVGRLDTATTANWLVPGMNSSLLDPEGYLRAAANLNFRNADSATVVFLGYESPKLPDLDVLFSDRAQAGGSALAAALSGYNAVRDQAGLDTQLTVVGHSYGTTTATYGLAQQDLRVDNVILVASAGIDPAITSGDLHAHGVYVTEAMRDDVADLGRLTGRRDPSESAFGAFVFGSDGATLADGTILEPVKGHDAIGKRESADLNTYFGRPTETMENIERIIHGTGDPLPAVRVLAPGATTAEPVA